MSLVQALNPQQRANLWVLFAAGLLFWSGLAAMLPTLPLYIQDIGGTSQQVGLVMGCFALGLLISRPRLARLADDRSRKIVLLIGMTAIAIAPLGYAIATSIPLLMTVRAFHGISIAAFATAYVALVVDLSPAEHRGELIGYMSLVNPLGLALGPALGGFLHEWKGFIPAFLMAAGLGMIGLICTSRIQEPQATQFPTSDKPPQTQNFWRMLICPHIRVPAFVLLMVGLAFGTITSFVPLYIKEAGVELNVGLFYTAAAIASFSIRLFTGRASDRYGRGLFISISLGLYVCAMLALWRADSAVTFLLAGILQGAGGGTLIPMIAALMADRSKPAERGRTFGLCMVGFDVGIAMAGPIVGAIADQFGYRDVFGLAAILGLVGLGVFLTQSSKDVAQSLRFATGRGPDVYAIAQPTFSTSNQR
ncbi:MAG: MFS transporter [Elainellaceae cyanobacterium]